MPQYNGVWTLEAAAQAQSNQQWVTDPNFKNTTLLLQADGTAGGSQNNTFIDSSINNFSITRTGNATQGSFTPFSQPAGWWSTLFSGAGSYIQSNTTTLPATTTSTFTIEFWYYPTSFATVAYIVGDMQPTSNLNYLAAQITTSGKAQLYWYQGPSSPTATSNTSLTLNSWNYVAIVVSSNAISMYVNSTTPETLSGTTTLTNRGGAVNCAIGQYSSNGFNGYLSNVRISTIARTISTVPTTPFITDSDTRILALQSSRFLDNGTAASTLTPTVASVQAFSPFAPQYQWTPTVIGGSGYFDGGTDYLSLAASSSWAFGTADLSVEYWFYLLAVGTTAQTFVGTRNGTSDTRWFINYLTSSAKIEFSGGTTSMITSNSTVGLNQWYHVVITRQSGRWRLFLNGVLDNTTTTAGNFTDSAVPLYIASQAGTTYYVNGYVSNMRIVTGSVPTSYQTASTTNGTAIFTPPTTPLTTSSQGATSANVSLLANFTNAGIYDNTMQNNLETVGNAQISTSIFKYGSGSMFFDGTGDYLTIPTIKKILPPITASANFTIETWIYCTQYQTSNNPGMLGDMSPTAATLYFGIGLTTTGSPYIYWYDGVSKSATAAGTVPLNTWVHVAYQSSNGSLSIFINGVNQTLSGTTTLTTPTGSTGALIIGQFNNGGAAGGYFGYLDDLRISKTIRYYQNFIPPQVSLPRQ